MFDGYNIKPTIFIDLKVKSTCCYKCFIAKTNLKKMFVSGPRPDNFFFQNVPAVTKTFFYNARVLKAKYIISTPFVFVSSLFRFIGIKLLASVFSPYYM